MLSGQTGKQTVLYSFFSRLSSTFLDPALPNSQTSEAFADWRQKLPAPAKKPRRKAGIRAKQGISELVRLKGLEPTR